MKNEPSRTPEIDKAHQDWLECVSLGGKVIADNAASFARQLEIQRDEARQDGEAVWEKLTDFNPDYGHLSAMEAVTHLIGRIQELEATIKEMSDKA